MNGFDFDLQRFAAIKIGGDSDAASSLSSGSASISATGASTWVESVSGGFNFGSSKNNLDGSVIVGGDTTWGATLTSGALTAMDGISNNASVTASMTDGTISTDDTTSGAKTYEFTFGTADTNKVTVDGDNDGVVFNVAGSAITGITGLNSGASLQANAGTYTVNGSKVNLSTGGTIISTGAGAYAELGPEATVDEVAKEMGVDVDNIIDTSTLATETTVAKNTDTGVTTIESKDDSTPIQVAISSSNTSEDGTVAVALPSSGGSAVSIDKTSTGTIGINFSSSGNNGSKGDYVGIAATSAAINLGGSGNNTVISAGTNVKYDLTKAGDGTRFGVAGKGVMNLSGYNPRTSRAAVVLGQAVSAFESLFTGVLKFAKGSMTIGNATINFGTSSSRDVAESADLVGSADLAESADTTAVNAYVAPNIDDGDGGIIRVGFTDTAGGQLNASDLGTLSDENWLLVGNNDGTKTGGSTLTSGGGNDTLFGGAADILNGGSGANYIQITNNAKDTLGATVSLNAEDTAKNTINGFQAGFGAGKNIIAADLTQSAFSFDDTTDNLVVTSGNNVSTIVASSDNGISASAVNELLVDNGSDVIKLALANNGLTLDASATEAVAYAGAGSAALDFSNVSGDVAVNVAEGTATVGGNTSGSVNGGFSTLYGGAGVTSLYGSGSNETFVAGTGRTSLWGGAGRDLLVGSTSADKESVTFGFVAGDGKDTIQNFAGANGSLAADALYVTEGLTNISASGNDVVVKLNSDDVLTMQNAVGKDINVVYEGETYVGQVGSNAVTVDGTAQYYYTTGNNASVVASDDAGSVNIWLSKDFNFGADEKQYAGNIKTLSAKGVSGNATLAGNENSNVITGGSGFNSLWGGLSGDSNDTLVAGSGKNNFFYGVISNDEGNDVINGAGANDTVTLLNLSVSEFNNEVSSWNVSNSAVSVDFKDGGSLAINGGANGTTYVLGDGTAWTYNKKTSSFQQK